MIVLAVGTALTKLAALRALLLILVGSAAISLALVGMNLGMAYATFRVLQPLRLGALSGKLPKEEIARLFRSSNKAIYIFIGGAVLLCVAVGGLFVFRIFTVPVYLSTIGLSIILNGVSLILQLRVFFKARRYYMSPPQ